MKHSINDCGTHVVVFLKDKLYLSDALLLRFELLEMIDSGVRDLRVDLSELTYFDSSGLGTFMIINRRAREKNGRLVLTGAKGLLLGLIKRTRLDRVFTIE